MENTARLAEDIAAWLRGYAQRAGARGYAVGLSGGVDSAVAAALCQRAVGEAVLAAWLPCHSLGEDAGFAAQVASALGLRLVTVDLAPACDALLAALPGELAPLTRANIKPRLRMTALYALAQEHRLLVAGTSNKSELLVGYFTKWGDGGADVEPLGGLFKSQVRALARELGVPQAVIERAPTAGLWQGQTDEGELGMTYDDIEKVLRAIEVGQAGTVDPELLRRVQARMAQSAHKRTLPPSYEPAFDLQTTTHERHREGWR